MKLIFLDIDGVLNTFDFLYREDSPKGNFKDEVINYLFEMIDPKKVKLLKEIVDATDAHIVLSSTWRINNYMETQAILQYYHLSIYDKTPISKSYCYFKDYREVCGSFRGVSILGYIKDNEKLLGDYNDYKDYVIIDDSSDMLYWQKDNFVHTDGNVGLTKEDVEKAIMILGEEK